MNKYNRNYNQAFTIVELLVVIVIIGILAAITIVSYSGISNKAISSSLQSDLDSDAKLLKMYNVEYGYYPSTLDGNYCPATPTADTRYCLKAMSGAALTYVGGGQAFKLIDKHTATNIAYMITDGASPVAYVSPSSFITTWGGAGLDYANSIAPTSDGGYAIAGCTSSFTAASAGFIARYNTDNSLAWNKTWGGTAADCINSIYSTSDDGFIVAGETKSYGAGNSDAFIAKYTSAGVLSWSKTFGGSDYDFASSVIQTSDGGYAMVGYTQSFSVGETFIAKYTSAGVLSWNQHWGPKGSFRANSVVQTSDGGYAIAGQFYSTSYAYDVLLMKYTSSGTLSWTKIWNSADNLNDYGMDISQTSDGGYVVAGYVQDYSGSASDGLIVKFTSTGAVTWSTKWKGPANTENYSKSITQTNDGGYIIVGQTYSYGAGSADVFVAKFITDGTLSWSKTFGGTALEDGLSVRKTFDGGYLVAGKTLSYGAGAGDAFVMKFKSDGSVNNCSNPTCQNISAVSGSRSATPTDVGASESSPSVTLNSYSAAVSIPTATLNTVVAP